MGALVDGGTIKFTYSVINDGANDEPMYSWYTSYGDTSDEWFETIEECKRDIERRF